MERVRGGAPPSPERRVAITAAHAATGRPAPRWPGIPPLLQHFPTTGADSRNYSGSSAGGTCAGRTQQGLPCTKRVIAGDTHCHIHR